MVEPLQVARNGGDVDATERDGDKQCHERDAGIDKLGCLEDRSEQMPIDLIAALGLPLARERGDAAQAVDDVARERGAEAKLKQQREVAHRQKGVPKTELVSREECQENRQQDETAPHGHDRAHVVPDDVASTSLQNLANGQAPPGRDWRGNGLRASSRSQHRGRIAESRASAPQRSPF